MPRPADPLTRPGFDPDDAPLFALGPTFTPSPSAEAATVAAASAGKRRHQVRAVLTEHGPLPIFRIAELLGVPQHQISGRFSKWVDERFVEITGEYAINPATGVRANVYRLIQPDAQDRKSVV